MGDQRETMSEERRRHYRVTPEAMQKIEVWLDLPSRSAPVRVALVDIAAGGAGLDLAQFKRGDVASGEMAVLELRSDELLKPVRIESQVVNVRNGVDRPLRLGLAFQNWMENRSTLDPQLWRLFNQRRTVRVEPEEEIQLVLRGKYGKKMRATIRDLSEEGLGLWIRRQGAEAAPEGARLELTLQLPGMRKELNVRAVATHLKIWQGAPVARSGISLGSRRDIPPDLRLALQRILVDQQRKLRAKGLVST